VSVLDNSCTYVALAQETSAELLAEVGAQLDRERRHSIGMPNARQQLNTVSGASQFSCGEVLRAKHAPNVPCSSFFSIIIITGKPIGGNFTEDYPGRINLSLQLPSNGHTLRH
jgi:hypothetical protein